MKYSVKFDEYVKNDLTPDFLVDKECSVANIETRSRRQRPATSNRTRRRSRLRTHREKKRASLRARRRDKKMATTIVKTLLLATGCFLFSMKRITRGGVSNYRLVIFEKD